jgi:hypothetical protein
MGVAIWGVVFVWQYIVKGGCSGRSGKRRSKVRVIGEGYVYS